MNKKAYESVSAMAEIRAQGCEKWDVTNYLATVKNFIHLWKYSVINTWLRVSLRYFFIYLGVFIIFSYGSYLIIQGQLSIGEFVAFSFYYLLAINHLTDLIQVIAEQWIVLFNAERLHAFKQQKPDVTEQESPVELAQVNGRVSFEAVSFRYREDEPDILKSFNLAIQPGEKVAIVGKSGNGKSTVLKLLSRFYDPQEGSIYLDQVPLTQLSLQQLRESIGFVFQESYLFGTTIADNIRFGRPEATDEEVVSAAKAAYCHGFIAQLEHGYETMVGERGVNLSGGQKQRLSIARMILKNPAIILLDEATSALDNLSENQIKKALDEITIGRTTIAVAHRISTIRNYDKIVVLDQGQVVESGTYDELMEAKHHFYQLTKQTKKDAVV